MNRIYEILKNNANFTGRLKLDEATNRLTIVYHEYCRLEYIEGNYASRRKSLRIYTGTEIIKRDGIS